MIHIPASVLAQLLSYAALIKLALAKQYGMSVSQLLGLVLVGNNGGVAIKELREKLSASGSSTTFTIDSLEKKRLIKRRRSKEDRRQWLLSLTARGERLYAEILEADHRVASPVLEKLSDTEKASFLKLAEETINSRAQTEAGKQTDK